MKLALAVLALLTTSAIAADVQPPTGFSPEPLTISPGVVATALDNLNTERPNRSSIIWREFMSRHEASLEMATAQAFDLATTLHGYRKGSESNPLLMTPQGQFRTGTYCAITAGAVGLTLWMEHYHPNNPVMKWTARVVLGLKIVTGIHNIRQY